MLKYQLDSIDDLDDSTKKLYKEKDGKFYLDIQGMPSGEDVSGLKAKVDQLLAEKKAESKKAKEAEEAAEAARLGAAKKSGDVEALEKSWQAKYDAREAALNIEINNMQSAVTTMTVDNVAVRLANEMAVQGSADLLIPHIKSRLAAEQRDGHFVTVVRDAAGKPSASTLDDLKNEFASNPAFAPVIVGSKATGGGANGSNGGGAAKAKTITRTQFSGMSPEARSDHFKGGGTITD